MEFSHVIFTEQRNVTTAEQQNGNRRMATEWWKPGITQRGKVSSSMCDLLTGEFSGKPTHREAESLTYQLPNKQICQQQFLNSKNRQRH